MTCEMCQNEYQKPNVQYHKHFSCSCGTDHYTEYMEYSCPKCGFSWTEHTPRQIAYDVARNKLIQDNAYAWPSFYDDAHERRFPDKS